MNDLDLCQLSVASYTNGYPWTMLIQPQQDDGVWVALIRVGDVDVLVYRGSITFQDWARDFFFKPHTMTGHPSLGMVHSGFFLGLEDALARLRPLLRKRVILVGHSLGAARALLTAALLLDMGLAAEAVVLFGEPKSGYQQLTDFVATLAIRSYFNHDANGYDRVTAEPPSTFVFPFTRARPLIPVSVSPAPNDRWGLLAYHHIELYAAGLPAVLGGAA